MPFCNIWRLQDATTNKEHLSQLKETKDDRQISHNVARNIE